MKTKRVTVDEVLTAMEDNGYKKITVDLIRYDDQANIVGACAIGQAAINLGVSALRLQSSLCSVLVYDKNLGHAHRLGDMIWRLNDRSSTPVPEIARKIRESLSAEILKTKISVPTHSYNAP